MSYIIVAEVFTNVEENLSGDISKVDARILSKGDWSITFDIRGDFYKQRELTRKLCNTLIDAGFVSFTIGHSY
jgi:hypothetical protein